MEFAKVTVDKVLVVRNDRFGEFLLNIPALRALRETFPKAVIRIVVAPYVEELARRIPYINQVEVWDVKANHNVAEKIKLIKRLRRESFKLAIMLNPSKEFNIFTYLAGIPLRVGYNRKWGFLLTHKLADRKHLGGKHEVEYNLELVRLIGADTKDDSISLPILQEDDIYIDNLLNKHNITKSDTIIILHPWTSDPVKQWPVDKFKELARRLLKETSVKIILIGGEAEEIKSEGFSVGISELINLAGKLTLPQSAALLKRGRLLISNDSGPVHLATAVKTPVIALFRNDIPGKSARRWGPWGEGNIVIEKNRIKEIDTEEVFSVARSLLKI